MDAAVFMGYGGRLLAFAVSYNAIRSAVTGVVLIAAGPMLRGPIGVPGRLLALVGVGLVGFAVLLVWLLVQPRRLRVGPRFVLVADVAWVLGAVVLLAGFPGLLAPAGRVGLGAVSVVVAAIAVGQAVGLRRRGHAPMTATSPVQLPERPRQGGCLPGSGRQGKGCRHDEPYRTVVDRSRAPADYPRQ